VWGFYYAFSTDLIHWTRRQLLFETVLTPLYQPGDPDPIAYPSLLDPDSPTRNFETTDQTAYLYFTLFYYQNSQMTWDRDLVRVPVQFFRSKPKRRIQRPLPISARKSARRREMCQSSWVRLPTASASPSQRASERDRVAIGRRRFGIHAVGHCA